jgi:hypothetical protein
MDKLQCNVSNCCKSASPIDWGRSPFVPFPCTTGCGCTPLHLHLHLRRRWCYVKYLHLPIELAVISQAHGLTHANALTPIVFNWLEYLRYLYLPSLPTLQAPVVTPYLLANSCLFSAEQHRQSCLTRIHAIKQGVHFISGNHNASLLHYINR